VILLAVSQQLEIPLKVNPRVLNDLAVSLPEAIPLVAIPQEESRWLVDKDYIWKENLQQGRVYSSRWQRVDWPRRPRYHPGRAS